MATKGQNVDDPGLIPWTTIWGLFRYAIYGGRVDNDHDIRVLFVYLRKFFYKDVINTNKEQAKRRLTTNLDLPSSNNIDDYRTLIHRLSDVDIPAQFSLSENCEGVVQQNQAVYIISQLRKLAVSSSLSHKFDREVWRITLTPLLQLWDKLTAKDNKLILQKPMKLRKKEVDYLPVESFVVLENEKVHELMNFIDTAISSLNNVVCASGLVSHDVRTDGVALMSGEVPWRWYRLWYGPTDPLLFLTEIVKRKQALLNWLIQCDNGVLLSSTLTLTELFTPRTFLNALRQQTARTTGVAIDTLRLAASWNEELLPSSATLRVKVDGLKIQGCGFVANYLSALTLDATSLSPLPALTIAYITTTDKDPYSNEKLPALSVPLYYSPSREDFITEIKIPTNQQGDRWVLTGVCLVLADFK